MLPLNNHPALMPNPARSWAVRHYHVLVMTAWLCAAAVWCGAVILALSVLQLYGASNIMTTYQQVQQSRSRLNERQNHATYIASVPATRLSALRSALPTSVESEQLLATLEKMAEDRHARLESLRRLDNSGAVILGGVDVTNFSAIFRVSDYLTTKNLALDLEKQARLLEIETMEYNAKDGLLSIQFKVYSLK